MTALGVLWSYSATLAAPALRLMLRSRQRRGKEVAGRLAERRGLDATPRPPGRLLWLHAASVGETVSLLPVLAGLVRRAPDLTVLMTTGTVTSASLLARRLDAGLEERVLHRFVPLDVPRWAARFLDHWRPDAAGFVESELWPNLLAESRRRGVKLMLINARMSPRSFAGWQRVPRWAREVLGGFALVQAQSTADADRLRRLGATHVTAPGDLKFAAPPLPADTEELARLEQVLADQPVWLAASTHPGEDELIFAAHKILAARHSGLLTIIAPRHPERGLGIAALGEGVMVTRRSAGLPPPVEGVWVADTLGELGLWYRLTQIVFVGRSLLPPGGGQNPLEPARLGCAVAVGPHTGNFADACAALREAGALTEVADAAALAAFVDALLRDPARRAAIGAAATAASGRYADLPETTAAALLDLLAG